MSVHVLIATIPPRRKAVEKLVRDILDQTLLPDCVHVCLDGYNNLPVPDPFVLTPYPLPHKLYRTAKPSGPGARWRITKELPDDAILVNFDDDIDISQQPDAIAMLVRAVKPGHAAGVNGCLLYEQTGFSQNTLLCAGAATLAVRVGDLRGLDDLAAEVKENLGFDPLGDCGDDEAVVAIKLWRRGVVIDRVKLAGIKSAQADTQDFSQTRKRLDTKKPGQNFLWQREEMARYTGWPWPFEALKKLAEEQERQVAAQVAEFEAAHQAKVAALMAEDFEEEEND